MKPNAFISSSFREPDKPLIEALILLIEECGIQVYQAWNVAEIPNSIIDKIREKELYIAILTDRIEDSPPAPVTFEVGAALTLNKKTIILREDTVAIQDFYGSLLQKKFNREKILSKDSSEEEKIKTAIRELLTEYGYSIHNLDPEIDKRFVFAQDVVQSVGSILLRYYNEAIYENPVKDQYVKNFPTQADLHANRIVTNNIQSDNLTRYDGVISEEYTKDHSIIRSEIEKHEFVWIVDPLDGTLNFAYGFPYFCVSIGVIRNGEPVIGIIFNPSTQELYCGKKGAPSEIIDLRSGTRRNLEANTKDKDLEDCVLLTHLSSQKDVRNITIPLLDGIMERCRSVRMIGSGQMALVQLALGRFDLFFNYQTHIWDIVPGVVILKGAGGYTTGSLKKEHSPWASRGIIAATNKVSGETFRKYLERELKNEFPSYS